MQRRLFLKTSAGLYFGLPFLEGLLTPAELRAQEGKPSPFLITMRNGCGREDQYFWQDSGNGSSISADQNRGKSVEPLSDFFGKMLFVGGVTPVVTKNYKDGCSHGISAGNLLTCGNYSQGNGDGMEQAHEESFDHYVHKKWGGIGNPIVAQLGFNSGKKHRVSWSGKHQEIAAVFNPFDLWVKIFGSDPMVVEDGKPKPIDPEKAVQQGSINAILPQLKELKNNNRLSAKDREKIEQHLTAVEEFEKKLAQIIADSQRVTKSVGPDQNLVNSLNGHRGRGNDSYNKDLGNVGNLLMDAIALGVATGKSRVATISMGVSIDFVNYGVGRHSGIDFHKSSHADESAKSGLPEDQRHQQLAANDKFFAERFAHLLRRLEDIPTSDGKMLDHGVAQWLCDMGPHRDHGHRQGELMHVVAGGGKIGMAQGKKLTFNNNLLMTRFLGTIGNALGVPGEKGGVMKDFHADAGVRAADATGSDSKGKSFSGVENSMLTSVKD